MNIIATTALCWLSISCKEAARKAHFVNQRKLDWSISLVDLVDSDWIKSNTNQLILVLLINTDY